MQEVNQRYMPNQLNKWVIDSVNSQMEIKLFCGFISEEMAELVTTIKEGGSNESMLDECSDVLGFTLVLIGKLGIQLDIDINVVPRHFNYKHKAQLYSLHSNATTDLMMTCNLLKNRPWKKQQYLVDRKEFKSQLEKAISSILLLILTCSGSIANLKTGFYPKLQTNYKRLDTQY